MDEVPESEQKLESEQAETCVSYQDCFEASRLTRERNDVT